ncbi:hypothetical protein VM1G_06968 [Cytospora mali]|uniref:Uncharacterized protein n=1 Tax=Cytospora mali TaxID=578113 RepID=A0A194W6C6_CYTMA|nr:hypothetical protein VM1G_06968 [Valsa mali]
MTSTLEGSTGPHEDEWDFYTNPPLDDEDPPRPVEVETLRSFVERYGSPNAIPASDAARRLMSLCDEDAVPPPIDPNVVVDKGQRIGYFLWEVGLEMPQYQPAILELVEAVQALPDLERTEQQVKEWRFKEKVKRWRDMEAFWEIWDEGYERCCENRYPSSLDGEDPRGLVNANAFKAHCLARNRLDPSRLRDVGAAFWLITTTLEQDPWNHAPKTRNHETHRTMLNTNIHALVPFFEIAGDVIYSFVDKKDLSWSDNLKYLDANLWKGEIKFTKSRWDFWKDRLQWVFEQGELKQRTRDEARLLAETMKTIEESGTSGDST